MARVLSIGLLNLLAATLDFILSQILIIVDSIHEIDLVADPTSDVWRQEKIFLLEIVFRFLDFEWVVDHFYLNRKCFFLHSEVADRESPLSALNHKGVAFLVEIAREILDIPSQSWIHAVFILFLHYCLLTFNYFEAFLLKKLENRVTFPHFH